MIASVLWGKKIIKIGFKTILKMAVFHQMLTYVKLQLKELCVISEPFKTKSSYGTDPIQKYVIL